MIHVANSSQRLEFTSALYSTCSTAGHKPKITDYMLSTVPFVYLAFLPVKQTSNVGAQLREKGLQERKSKSVSKNSVLFSHAPRFAFKSYIHPLPKGEASHLNTQSSCCICLLKVNSTAGCCYHSQEDMERREGSL